MVFLKYDSNRFISLAWEGIKRHPSVENHQGNFVEKTANGLLYIQEQTPRFIKDLSHNPQAITLATFTVTQIAQSYLFYPEQTVEVLNHAVSYLPEISMETVRFGLWLTSFTTITGYCGRAGGRLLPAYIKKLDNQAKNQEIGLNKED